VLQRQKNSFPGNRWGPSVKPSGLQPGGFSVFTPMAASSSAENNEDESARPMGA